MRISEVLQGQGEVRGEDINLRHEHFLAKMYVKMKESGLVGGCVLEMHFEFKSGMTLILRWP